MLTDKILSILTELEQFGHENDSRESERNRRMLNLEPDTAALMNILVRSSNRTHILEIGTSNGYSTIWLAWAAQAAGGKVISLDRDEGKHAMADENLRRVGLREWVDLKTGDATEIVRALPGPFDMVFFDADRYSAPAQLDILLPKLAPGALLLADNVLSHPQEIAGYLEKVQSLPNVYHTVVPVGKGLSIAYLNEQDN